MYYSGVEIEASAERKYISLECRIQSGDGISKRDWKSEIINGVKESSGLTFSFFFVHGSLDLA